MANPFYNKTFTATSTPQKRNQPTKAPVKTWCAGGPVHNCIAKFCFGMYSYFSETSACGSAGTTGELISKQRRYPERQHTIAGIA